MQNDSPHISRMLSPGRSGAELNGLSEKVFEASYPLDDHAAFATLAGFEPAFPQDGCQDWDRTSDLAINSRLLCL